eukprot:TRINITY_DN35608_c0_g1_i1.p1 TRINITY_DN35608_c0_g1~~TRINITY_DN35608_c0_g1_i1.p1  ORF type:complete len:159 (-),score=28.87 TRINITY_DN35608_c0_g1_i1:47-523(-)
MILIFLLSLCIALSEGQCNCFECKNVTEGIHKGEYYYLDSGGNTATCLYRDPHTGKIIRACDEEASLGDNYAYEICENVTGPEVCIDPPVASDYGYANRTWDGTKDIQVSKVSYFCEPPKLVTGYNGSAVYDIWCSAANFPRWQFTVGYNDLPRCMLN